MSSEEEEEEEDQEEEEEEEIVFYMKELRPQSRVSRVNRTARCWPT